jgi:RNA polymerase sigma factor (sigma-70 family)
MSENPKNANEPACSTGWLQKYEDNALGKLLMGCARRWLPDGQKDEAEDVVQETYVRVFTYTEPGRIGDHANYLIKVLRRICINRCKDQHLTAANTVQLDACRNDEDEDIPMELPDPKRGPEVEAVTNIESDRLMDRIRAQFEDLTEREKCLIEWHLAGLSNEQIAYVLDENIAVVRVAINRIVAKIRYRVNRGSKHKPERDGKQKNKGASSGTL